MSVHYRWFVVIFLLTAFGIYVALPADLKGIDLDAPICQEFALDHTIDLEGAKCDEHLTFSRNAEGEPILQINITESRGLDLVGGLRVLLEADISEDAYTPEDLRETANNVGRRVNALGLTEATVQVQGGNRVLVELPGVRDREQAISTIQQTALLEFVDFGGLSAQAQGYDGRKILTTRQLELQSASTSTEEGDPFAEHERHPVTGEPFSTVFTGADLAAASAQFASTQQGGSGQWQIAFEFVNEQAQAFGDYTGSRVGEPMAIVLDGEVLSAPTIQSRLDGSGVITGNFTQEEAQQLALQLRSGALPIPLSISSVEEVGATLGQTSVNLSIRAGSVGIVVVLLFMLIYYRVPGIAADIALLVFIVLNLALFKLIPITVTLPAITGFLISVGTAVDGNILIFERIKEEVRAGLNLDDALQAGFERAWTSIRDSNLSTIIICVILFFFGQTPGASIVSGFAVTLGLGLVLNLFTAIIVTRTMLYIIVNFAHDPIAERKEALLGV